MQTVAILDYGMGNLDSVARAVEECGARALVTPDPEQLTLASAVILPGVGAFAPGMENLRRRGFVEALRERVVAPGTPLLGLCLGMQLLASRGTEVEEADGLGLVDGSVLRIDPGPGLRVPHVGWNEVRPVRPSLLLKGIEPGRDFYFAHSYHLACSNDQDAVGYVQHGKPLVAVVERGSVFGVQFHPEKSQRAGFQLLRNFLELAGAGAGRPRGLATSAG